MLFEWPDFILVRIKIRSKTHHPKKMRLHRTAIISVRIHSAIALLSNVKNNKDNANSMFTILARIPTNAER